MKQYSLAELRSLTAELRVLYVEDEAMIRDGMASSLKQLFGEVVVAVDGEDGLNMYKQFNFHLVITDISMPKMNGIDMVAKIKELNPEAKIIITSAQNEADKLLQLINLGVDRFLIKPLNKTALIEALYTICSNIVFQMRMNEYHAELKRAVRLLNTKMKKEYIKDRQSNPSVLKKSNGSTAEIDSYFSHILPEERDELIDLNEELDADILMAFKNDQLDHTYVDRVANQYMRYGSVLNTHLLFAQIGARIQHLSKAIQEHEKIFLNKISVIRELLESFNFTLISFRKNIFEQESSNPTFYNASLLSDIQMIQDVLEQTEVVGDIEFF